MKFFTIILISIFYIVLQISKNPATAEGVQCDTNNLKGLINVDFFASAKVAVDGTFRINCRDTFSIKNPDGSISRSFLVRCTSKGDFSDIKSCQKDEMDATCNTDQLRREPNLDYYWSKDIALNNKLKLTCKKSYGVETEDRIEKSYNVVCNPGGKFSGIKRCIQGIDVSEAVKAGLRIKMEVYTVKSNGERGHQISSEKIIRMNEKIKIECLPLHFIKDLSTEGGPEVTSYIYSGGKDPIYKCTPKPVVVPIAPPSTPDGNFIPKFKCNVNNIIIPNGKITAIEEDQSDSSQSPSTGRAVASTISAGKKVTITCQVPFAVTNGETSAVGGKLTDTFDVTCDPSGTGKFLNIKYCAERCDAGLLREAAKGKPKNNAAVNNTINIVSPVKNNPSTISSYPVLGTVNQKNTDDLEYVERGQTVMVMCAPGYEVRKTSEKGFTSNCTSAGFDKTDEICETEIKPCENNEVSVDGFLENADLIARGKEDAPTLKGKTIVGQRLKVECRGGAKYRIGLTKRNGAPKCRYNKTKGVSEWDRTTFDCFNGCIPGGGDDTNGVAAGTLKYYDRNTVKPVWSYSGCNSKFWYHASDFILNACTRETYEAPLLRGFIVMNDLRSFEERLTTFGMEPNLKYQNAPNFKQKFMHVSQRAQVRVCKSRQTPIIDYVVIQDAVHSSYFAGKHGQVTSWLGVEDWGGDKYSNCSGNFRSDKGSSQFGNVCESELKEKYGGGRDGQIVDISFLNFPDNKTKCEKLALILMENGVFKNSENAVVTPDKCWGVENLWKELNTNKCSTTLGNGRWYRTVYIKTICTQDGDSNTKSVVDRDKYLKRYEGQLQPIIVNNI